jgi:hypothetical protein
MPDDVHITDRAGISWSAREIPGLHLEFNDEMVEHHATYLRFEALQGATRPARVVRRYPSEWRSLPREVLVGLLDDAEPVTRVHARCVDDAELRRHLDELST